MKIHASFICAALLGLAACQAEENATERALGEAQQAGGERVRAASDKAEECLIAIWEAREASGDFGGEPERDYDRANDRATGGAISCALGSSASQFEATLAALRNGANNADRAGLLEEAGIPMLYIAADGTTRELSDRRALESAFDQVFTEATLEKLRHVALADMTVVPDKGGFFDLGAIWLVVPETGARPRLVTINDQAAAESAAVRAREAAQKAKDNGEIGQ